MKKRTTQRFLNYNEFRKDLPKTLVGKVIYTKFVDNGKMTEEKDNKGRMTED